jgi:hypothetical protein
MREERRRRGHFNGGRYVAPEIRLEEIDWPAMLKNVPHIDIAEYEARQARRAYAAGEKDLGDRSGDARGDFGHP